MTAHRPPVIDAGADAAAQAGLPDRLAEPAEGLARLCSRSPPAWPPPCRIWTCSRPPRPWTILPPLKGSLSAYDASPASRNILKPQVRRLRAEGQAFAVATIVRTVDATSAKPGAKALVLADGTLVEGWIGGGCARSAVSKAAAAALARGQAAIRLAAARRPAGRRRRGAGRGTRRHPVCPQRLPEPRLDGHLRGTRTAPAPPGDLWRGPVALALADLAARFDLHRTLCGAGSDGGDRSRRCRTASRWTPTSAAQRFVVVATQGKGDEAALRAAHRQWRGLCRLCRQPPEVRHPRPTGLPADGIDRASLAAVKAPAGLNIHAITPDEIALSILAEIVQTRRSGERGTGAG